MTENELDQFMQSKAQIVVCEHCQQEYGRLPDIDGMLDGIPTGGKYTTRHNGTAFSYYARNKVHCVQCGQCDAYVQEDTLYHPMGDQPICETCYLSYKSGDSSYIFEEDFEPFLPE